jgi:antitoxin (DNA-binding transcriptional repressor) of toxin-antitoxin stability system
MEFPMMTKIKQKLPTQHVADVPAAVRAELRRADLATRVKPGSQVAITVGSRGIADITTVVSTLIQELQAIGAQPFIVPAMGSHGGATAEGQIQILEEYGFTEASMGVPIKASMETVQLGTAKNGAPVHMDKNAYGADATIVVARVKNHTSFRAPIESGLCKMMAIGLGKQKGAHFVHNAGLAETVTQAAEVFLAKANIALGLALVENAFHQLYAVEAVTPESFLTRDEVLLVLANSLLPRVPFNQADVLIIDWMGKNISGTGIDFNIAGMWRRIEAPMEPFYETIVVLDLTPESGGNAIGVGTADFAPMRLINKIDRQKTYMNLLTAAHGRKSLQHGKFPIALATDRECIEAALEACALTRPARVCRITSTLHLDEMWISQALEDEARAIQTVEFTGQRILLASMFDDRGNIKNLTPPH